MRGRYEAIADHDFVLACTAMHLYQYQDTITRYYAIITITLHLPMHAPVCPFICIYIHAHVHAGGHWKLVNFEQLKKLRFSAKLVSDTMCSSLIWSATALAWEQSRSGNKVSILEVCETRWRSKNTLGLSSCCQLAHIWWVSYNMHVLTC